MDHQDTLSLWCETTGKKNMQDILAHPEKTYIDHMTLNGTPYDVAATATDDGSRLILCYASTEKPASDPYELTIRSILTNNSFDKNPTLVITDGTQVLSTNSAIVDELGTTQYHQLASTIQWKDGAFTKFDYQHTTYYGLRRVYSSYYVYAVYAEVKADYYPTVMHFLDLDTMPERLKGKPFLGCEVKDCHDAWFSVMLIPQKFDGYGNIQALLITTRDITSVKQTEELAFKDKLTGLHNRN